MRTDELRTVQQIPVHHIGEQPKGPGQPQVRLTIVANVVTAQWTFRRAGDMGEMHVHPHDHQTLVARGAVRIVCPEGGELHEEGQIIVIRKGIPHSIMALRDNTVIYCIQALRKSELEDDIVGPDESTDSVAPLTIGRAK